MAENGDSADVRPITRPSLHDAVVGHIREMIFSGELAPGDRVPEKQLCQRLDVSRTPLREALKVLASEGLLTLLPNRGARVSQLTTDDVDEMFPVMGALEALAGQLACERISDAEIDEIRALHYQMASHHKREALNEYFELNQRIHAAILEAAGNETLRNIYLSLTARIRMARYQANLSRARWDAAMAEHEEILEALIERDGQQLAEVLRKHLAATCEAVKDVIRSTEEGTDAGLSAADG